MRKKLIISILIVGALALLVTHKLILTSVTKNWEKDIFQFENNKFSIDMSANLAKGCVRSDVDFNNGSLDIYNRTLADIILLLAGKNINTSEFIDFKKSYTNKFNFSYSPKDTFSYYSVYSNDIINCLAQEFDFSYSLDTMEKTVIIPRIINYEKLKHKETLDSIGRFTTGKNYISFKGNTLPQIFRAFNYFAKDVEFEHNIHDTLYYSFKVPNLKKQNVIEYFENELGIECSEEFRMKEILTVKFK